MNREKVYEVTEQKLCPGSYDFTWDGTMNTGNYEGMPDGEEPTNIAPTGLYTFDVEVTGVAPYDHDWLRSKELKVVPGPVEYYGYDDGGTPDDESDDNYLYYLRWYALHSGRNATWGEIWLYDPDLMRVSTCAVPMLKCVVHGWNDGLVANPEGEVHGVILKVPIGVFNKVGFYRFVLHFYDNYADSYKNHQIKPSLERNAIYLSWPVVWINGYYADAEWFGVWVDMRMFRQLAVKDDKGIKTVLLNPINNTGNSDTDLPSVQKYVWGQIISSYRAGNLKSFTVRAAVNGTFFNHHDFPYPLQGHVGTGSGWPGNDIKYHRWAFGISGSLNFTKERMTTTSSGLYTVPQSIKSNPFGLSGIGCLIKDGIPVNDPNEVCDGFTYLEGKYARSLIAWTKQNDHFFMIWAFGGFMGHTKGWTWREARDFLLSELPNYMQTHHRVNISIYNGMLLDSGSHSDLY